MKTPVSNSKRADHLDVEQFRSMVESAAFRRVWARIRADYERAGNMCVAEDTELALRRAQGAAAALRTVLGLPEQILQEMRDRAGQAR